MSDIERWVLVAAFVVSLYCLVCIVFHNRRLERLEAEPQPSADRNLPPLQTTDRGNRMTFKNPPVGMQVYGAGVLTVIVEEGQGTQAGFDPAIYPPLSRTNYGHHHGDDVPHVHDYGWVDHVHERPATAQEDE